MTRARFFQDADAGYIRAERLGRFDANRAAPRRRSTNLRLSIAQPMNMPRNRFLLVLLALLAVSVSPLRAATVSPNSTFFDPASYLGNDDNGYPVYYLDYFGTFTYDQSDEDYVYKYGFGWLYNFGGTTDDSDDVYLYDFATDDVFYTADNLYPYFYSFNLDTYLYYFEGTDPREFYDFATSQFTYYPSVDE